MNLKEVLDRTTQFFREKKFESPRLEAEILLSGALKYNNRVDLYLKFDQPLKDHEMQVCREAVRRRSQGEPVAYILGQRDFYGFTFKVTPQVLIPRPETELLAEAAIEWAKAEAKKEEGRSFRILDLGTGSGCLGIAVAKKIENSQVVLVDLSAEAAQVARENAIALGVGERVQVLESDVLKLDFAQNSFEIIVANPPYIANEDPEIQDSVKKYEPHLALFAEEQGYAKLKTWSGLATVWLTPSGFMGFEMGATQGPEMQKHFDSLNVFTSVKIIKDLAGLDRHIIGKR